MTGDPLDRMYSWLHSGNDLTTEDCYALVAVARAARDWDADLSDACDGPIRDRLRAALARLDGDPE